MKENRTHICGTMLFLLVLMIFTAGTLKNTLSQKEEIRKIYADEGYSSSFFKKIDNLYRENSYYKSECIELYGIVNKILEKKIIGNFEFAKNHDNVMQMLNISSMEDNPSKDFAQSLLKVNDVIGNRYPLIYFQMPLRNDGSVPEEWDLQLREYNNINQILDRNNQFEVYRENEIMQYIQLSNKSEIYFRTDLHLTTEAELRMADMLVDLLNDKGCDLKHIDRTDYNYVSHVLYGNLVHSLGRKYLPLDKFDELIPKNDSETCFTLTDLTDNKQIKKGKFTEAVMNGFNDRNDENLYWVVDYLQYPKYSYEIKNENINNGTKLLFICDSYCYRTVSYLALECESITIVDPRFSKDGGELLKRLITENSYDAAICLHGTTMTRLIQ